ncbi:MAG: hypothetical protein H8D67_04730 [Deltaproteobacteria bacterium]|nr:hypothetical protein [Deltaproteobacteria bacterium]
MKFKMLLMIVLYTFILPLGYAQQSEISDPISDAADKLCAQAKTFFAVKEARVLKVAAGKVYLNLGDEQGIVPGMEFDAVRKGEEIVDPMTNEVLGTMETEIGQLTIVTVRGKMSIATIINEQPNLHITEGDAAFSTVTRMKIAVAELIARDNQRTALGMLLSEMLMTKLSQEHKFQVIARSKLKQSLQKLGFSTADLLAPDAVQKVGQVAGADVVIIGTVWELGDRVDVTIRLIDTQTGDIITSAHTTLTQPSGMRVDRTITATPTTQRRTDASSSKVSTETKSSITSKTSATQNPGDVFFQEDFSQYERGVAMPDWGDTVVVLRGEDGRHYLTSQAIGENSVRREVNFPPDFSLEFETYKRGLLVSFTLKFIDDQGQVLPIVLGQAGLFPSVTLGDGREEQPRSFSLSGGANTLKVVKTKNLYRVYFNNDLVTSGSYDQYSHFIAFEITANLDHMGFTDFIGKIPEQ